MPGPDDLKERLDAIVAACELKNSHQPEFLQAVHEVAQSIRAILTAEYLDCFEACLEPERVISFRVSWEDDSGRIRHNRGYRVQMNGSIGPYKGGTRFAPTVNESVLKFLAYEQTFKNSLLSTLSMGGGKAGIDVDTHNLSNNEIRRICTAFMTELYRHIGADRDVPAGDLGVGAREIGYMFGAWKRITAEHVGVLTGKGVGWGGSLIRPEATGYGVVFFLREVLRDLQHTVPLEGARVAISGCGAVALFTIEKLLAFGAVPVTVSDSSGTIIDEAGITREGLEYLKSVKKDRRKRVSEYLKFSKTAKFFEKKRPWSLTKVHVALPCATQNELDRDDAAALLANKDFVALVEGANMPCTPDAIHAIIEAGRGYAPGKASNAGGVAVSGLEMAQNSQRIYWHRDEVEAQLLEIMTSVYRTCVEAAEEAGSPGNLMIGANVAGFKRVADAMIAQGQV